MNVLVVSPHRDDAAFSLGLTIEGWCKAGYTVTVLNCFTQSDWAPFSDAGTLHSNDRVSFVTALRRREDIAWSKLLGANLHFHDLDLFDAPLRLSCAVEEVFAVDLRPGDRALTRVTGAIAKLARGAAAVLAPLAIGNHVDHRIARQAALDAIAAWGLPLAFYEDLPYAAEEGISDGVASEAAAVMPDLRSTFAGAPAADGAAAATRKARFAECYDSQIDSTVVHAIAKFSGQYEGRERLWVSPAWFASPLAEGAAA